MIREIIATGHGLPAEFSNHQMLEALEGRWSGTGNKFSQAMNSLGKSGELRFVRREGGSPIWSIPLRRSAPQAAEE